jgi:hypothetical protein
VTGPVADREGWIWYWEPAWACFRYDGLPWPTLMNPRELAEQRGPLTSLDPSTSPQIGDILGSPE